MAQKIVIAHQNGRSWEDAQFEVLSVSAVARDQSGSGRFMEGYDGRYYFGDVNDRAQRMFDGGWRMAFSTAGAVRVSGGITRLSERAVNSGIVTRTVQLDPHDILFSQASVRQSLPSIVESMRASGWKPGTKIDVVKMPNGKLVSVDNTRLAAAKITNTPVRATIRGYREAFPTRRDINGLFFSNRITKAPAQTWGEAVLNRIARQPSRDSAFQRWFELNPQGSSITGVHPKSGLIQP